MSIRKYRQGFSVVYLAVLVFGSLLLSQGVANAGDADASAGSSAVRSADNNIGRSLTASEVRALDMHIFPDGAQLAAGEGSVEAGRNIYQQQCANCHGGSGEGASAVELVGDRELLTTQFPDKGIGVYWPYVSTLFQYIQRAMPPDNPGLLTNSELYSLIGYLLHLNGLLAQSSLSNREILAEIVLPNRYGFIDQ